MSTPAPRRAELEISDLRGTRVVPLDARVLSLGRAAESDVRIDAEGVKPRHAHVLRDQGGHRLFVTAGASGRVNGRRRVEHALADGDRIQLGEAELAYRLRSAVPTSEARATDELPSFGGPDDETPEATLSDSVPLEAFKRLYRFSARIAGSPDLPSLERKLVDAVIELAGADTGLLLAANLPGSPGEIRLEVARRAGGEELPPDTAAFSASMVEEVLRERRPLLVRDALEDDEFAERRSVVDYRLRSVLALPITLGEQVLGVLYLGCDRTAAFTPSSIEIMSVFAAQAGLLMQNARLVDGLRERNQALEAELVRRSFGEIVGDCASMQEVFRKVSRVAPTDITVLLLGETGTGKELVAHELHRRSGRSEGPFVAINMAAIPENLLEAELFGHVRGAFTGAVSDRRGKLAEAHGGTLFLDEIGDLPLGLQAKLLRVLQERAVSRLGSNRSEPIDVRVVAATHRDLEALREEGIFRDDLYYRLDEMQLHLPPLRERGDDVELLARWFLGVHAPALGRELSGFTKEALAAMRRCAWRGNVRELESRVKKAIVLSDGPALTPEDLGLGEKELEPIVPLKEAKERFAAGYVREVLALHQGNRSQTARELGVDPRTIYKYLEGK